MQIDKYSVGNPDALNEHFNSKLDGKSTDVSVILEDVIFTNHLHSSWKYFYIMIEEFQKSATELGDIFACKYSLDLFIELMEDKELKKYLISEAFNVNEQFDEGKKKYIKTFILFFNIVTRELAFSVNTKEAKQEAISSALKLRDYMINPTN